MNSTVYLFGNFCNGYSQYPEDNTKDVFQKFYEHSKENAQLTIHREGNVMYYGYVRKLNKYTDSDKYIGMCVVLNGVMVTNMDDLFTIFETTFNNIVSYGDILGYNEVAAIIPRVNKIFDKVQDAESFIADINRGVQMIEKDCKKLPPVNYEISNDNVKYLNSAADNERMVNSSYRYGYTIISKSESDQTSLSNYDKAFINLRTDRDALKTEYDRLVRENKRLATSKRNRVFSVLLFLASIVFGTFMYVYNKESNDKLEEISAISPLVISSIEIANFDENDSTQVDDPFSENTKKLFAKKAKSLVTKITYTNVNNTNEVVPLKIKWMLEVKGHLYYITSQDENIEIAKGTDNEFVLPGTKVRDWGKGLYVVEIWYKDMCLKAKEIRLN